MIETLTTSFVLGLFSTLSPCVLPLYPGFLAYLTGLSNRPDAPGQKKDLGLWVLMGVLSMMLALGALIAALSVSIGRALAWLVPAADLIIFTLGVMLILNINPFKQIPMIRIPLLKSARVNAYVYGLLYGPLTLPCSGPLVVSIFAYSFTAQEAIDKLLVFFSFGLGFGLPLLIISLLSGVYQHKLVRFFARHSTALNRASGLLMVVVAIFDLLSNAPMLMLFWNPNP